MRKNRTKAGHALFLGKRKVAISDILASDCGGKASFVLIRCRPVPLVVG